MARLGYTNEDFLNLLLIHGECGKIAARTCRTFAERYPNKIVPNEHTIRRLLDNCTRNGSFRTTTDKEKPIVNSEENEVNVLGYFAAYPTNSLRDAAKDLGISVSSSQRILRKHKMHPYSYYNVHGLKPGDMERRVSFCEWLYLRYQENDQFLKGIIWTDESKFTKNGIHNRHNSHYWNNLNPHLTREVYHQDSWSFNVFVAIKHDKILCFHIYDENLNSERYLHILENILVPALEDLPILEYFRAYYQQDGAPPHNSRIVSNFLERTFNGNWIGNNGPYLWPPRTPDLTPIDYFLWGTIKNKVYDTPPTTKENMVERVRVALNSLSREEIRKVTSRNLIKRVEVCLGQQGGIFENILKERR